MNTKEPAPEKETAPKRGPVKRALIGLIRFYQRFISSRRPPVCRFTPTCSAYAIQAIEMHGALKGTGLAVWRILRCNPWGGHGYDPVPEKKEKSRKSEKRISARKKKIRTNGGKDE